MRTESCLEQTASREAPIASHLIRERCLRREFSLLAMRMTRHFVSKSCSCIYIFSNWLGKRILLPLQDPEEAGTVLKSSKSEANIITRQKHMAV
jgi:hypothetical protein